MAISWSEARDSGRALFRPVEVAELCSVSRGLIYRLISLGELKSVRIAGAVRISVEEVQRLVTEGVPDVGRAETWKS